MAAIKGKKDKRPNIHLLQESHTGAFTPSTFSSACSSGFVGGLSEWVGFKFPSPFQRQGHDSNIIQGFYVSNCF